MARRARSHRAPGSLEPGSLYHVTNRGVDRCDIFRSELDRIVFLSMLAEALQHFGAVCHAWCLMTNHFHAVIEDSNGTLSQILHRLEAGYASYFNTSRAPRRRGPLFESRFRAELIDTRAYFDAAVAYVHLNPLEPEVPLAESAEEYRWSSAGFICSDADTQLFFAFLIESFGGVESIARALPVPSRKSGREAIRARLEALRSGAWTSREHVLAGRSAEAYREFLARRHSGPPAFDPQRERSDSALPPSVSTLPLRSRPVFAGFGLPGVLESVQLTCERLIPQVRASDTLRDTILYVVHRFTSAPLADVARSLKMRATSARRIVSRMAADRIINPAWGRTLWQVEWSLRWQLGAGPHRS